MAWSIFTVICGLLFSTGDAVDAAASIYRNGTVDSIATQRQKTAGASHKQVLLFWAVSSRSEVMELVKNNLRRMRLTAGSDCCDVFLAHYDGREQAWRKAFGDSWYNHEVAYSSNDAGFKFQLLQQHFQKEGQRSAWTQRYNYVWALDEDIDVQGVNFGEFLHLADQSNAYIMGPAFTEPDGQLTWEIQNPHEECDFRYTNYVEVIAPIIRTSALKAILMDCKHCIHQRTVWGLDGVWCNFVGHKLNSDKLETTCALLDKTPVFHRDFKTLKGKYTALKTHREDFQKLGKTDSKDVETQYPNFYVRMSKQTTFRCMRGGQSATLSAKDSQHLQAHRLADVVDRLAAAASASPETPSRHLAEAGKTASQATRSPLRRGASKAPRRRLRKRGA